MTKTILLLPILLSVAFTAQSQWSVKTSFPKQEAPQGIINSQFEITPTVAINNTGAACAFLQESFGGMSGGIANKAMVISRSGKKLAEVENILPISVQIKKIVTDASGIFWISAMEGERSDNHFPHAVIYAFDSLLHQKYFLSLDSVFFPVALMEKRATQFYLSFLSFNQLDLFGKQYKDFKENSLQLMLVDFKSQKVISRQQLESTGDILNDAGFFVLNQDSSFFLVQNTVILRGADHHDVHVYSFNKKGSLQSHRQLKGVGELTHLWAEQVLSSNNQLTINGFSDDLINFEKIDMFFKERAKQVKASTIIENDYSGSNRFQFHIAYDQKLKLLEYSFSDPLDEYADAPPQQGVLRNGKFEINYRNKSGTENTSEPPVFEFYKN